MPLINIAISLSILATIFFIAADTLSSLAARWGRMDESYSHGFLVVGIVCYLIYLQKDKLKSYTARPDILSALVLFLAVLFFGACKQLGINVLQEMLLPPIIWLSFVSIFGREFGKVILVPILFFYFAIPFWDYLAYPLQLITVWVNEFLLNIFSINAIIEGVFVTLPNIGVFEVAQGCSGLRYLIVGLTIASLFSILNLSRWKNRIVFILFAITFSLAANWIRVFIIIYVGHETNMTSSLIDDHDFFGWVVFAVSLVPVFVFAHYLQRAEEGEGVDTSSDMSHCDVQSESATQSKTLVTTLGVIILCLALPSTLTTVSANTEELPKLKLSNNLTDWKKLAVNVGVSNFSKIKGYSHSLKSSFYNSEQNIVMLNMYLFPHQSPGNELIQYSNHAIDTNKWNITSVNKVEIASLPFSMSQVVSRDGGQYIIVYSYYVSGNFWRDRIKAKLGGLRGFLNERHDGSLILLSSACDGDCEKAERNVTKFLNKNINTIYGAIDHTVLAN